MAAPGKRVCNFDGAVASHVEYTDRQSRITFLYILGLRVVFGRISIDIM
jgi:hypothetical protein